MNSRSGRFPLRHAALAPALALAVAAVLISAAACVPGGGNSGGGEPSAEDPVARHKWLFAKAWGPESPEVLASYLEVRKTIAPRFHQYEDGLRQYALREVSTQAIFGPAMLGATLMRRDLERALEEHGLTFTDYQRLTILVYGRYLRASRAEAVPETRLVRVLQELEIALSRRLANNSPQSDTERQGLEERLASVSHQRLFLSPYAAMNKERVLARIDPATKAWLDERRADIEALDFDIFDTLVPPREATKPAPAAES